MTTTDCYYAHCSPDDPMAYTSLELRKIEYTLLTQAMPTMDDDWDIVVRDFMCRMGWSRYIAERNLGAIVRLDDLPLLRNLHEQLWHIDMARWAVIDSALHKVDPNDHVIFAEVDAMLVDYLTPTKAGLVMPSASAIRKKINDLITLLDTSIAGDDEIDENTTPTPQPSYEFRNEGEHTYAASDSISLVLALDENTATEIDAHIRQHANNTNLSLRDAAVDILLNGATTTINLHYYQASDIDTAPVFAANTRLTGTSVCAQASATGFGDRTVINRDVDVQASTTGSGYGISDGQRAYVHGRDGTCRYPGCSVDANCCQLDHVIEYNRGGATTASNLVCLCQHHHNIKTDQRARPILEPASGLVVWLFDDGHWQTTTAEGPLSTANRNWVSTISQRLETLRAQARAQAQSVKRKLHDSESNNTHNPSHPSNPDPFQEPPF